MEQINRAVEALKDPAVREFFEKEERDVLDQIRAPQFGKRPKNKRKRDRDPERAASLDEQRKSQKADMLHSRR